MCRVIKSWTGLVTNLIWERGNATGLDPRSVLCGQFTVASLLPKIIITVTLKVYPMHKTVWQEKETNYLIVCDILLTPLPTIKVLLIMAHHLHQAQRLNEAVNGLHLYLYTATSIQLLVTRSLHLFREVTAGIYHQQCNTAN